MQIINYLLIIYFINLCNSFTIINKKVCFYYRKYKLDMSCDFYIDKDLHIYNNDNTILSYINLEHERGYYWFSTTLDEDENEYNTKLLELIEEQLKSNMKPIVIYSNNKFNKLSFENKYKKIIENELNIYNKSWNDIHKIIKIENRYKK